ncbi:MAG: utilization substance protein B-like protein [Gemmatimonadetes bacterium]|nr:utilization substance protein B-like protein [Gemmatimonadota bacterium]
MKTRLETRARSRALQALYAWDLRPGADLLKIANTVWDDLGVAPGERSFASLIIRELAKHGKEIDAMLVQVTENWRLERLGVIERCVLRLAAAEFHQEVTPPRVVIQEGVRLAERYGSEQSARFVNGVLDALARRMGRL